MSNQPPYRTLNIGGIPIDPPIVLAPMAGYTDSAFRSLCMHFRCGATYTEVVNAESLRRGSKYTLHLLETKPEERPIAGHIYGNSPEVLAEAAQKIVELKRFDFIDINCGCPLRKIVSKGAGAALIRDPAKIAKIVSTVRAAVNLPVTIKTRVGFSPDNMNVMEIAQAVTEAGAAAIAVHGRFATKVHSGPSDWETIARLKSASRIPVIGNGGITSAADAVRLLRETGVDGVMIGRAAVGRPWIFDEAWCLLNGKTFTPPAPEERRQMILDHLEEVIRLKGMEQQHRRRNSLPPDMAAVLQFRAHLYKYLQGLPGWPLVRRNLQEVKTRMHVMESIRVAFAESAPGFDEFIRP